MLEGQGRVWPLARQLGVKLAWGTNLLFEPRLNLAQNAHILRLQPWLSQAELILLRGGPQANLAPVAEPAAHFEVIVQDGRLVKGPR